jgi:SAM-dependent methyltransferase
MKVNNNFRQTSCPLCFSKNIFFAGNIEYLLPVMFSTQQISLENKPELWSCKNCGSGFTQNVVPETVASTLYEKGLSTERWAADSIEKSKNKEIIDTLEDVFQRNKTVLDIGCNTGELLDFAKAKGCKTFGVELSDTSRAILKKKGHVTFTSMGEADGSYDIITAFDLVEHLYDFSKFLDYCSQRLTKDGLIVILTGDISSLSARVAGVNWWYLKYPEHIQFISQTYLKSIPGFRVEHLFHTYCSVGYKQSFVNVCKGLIFVLLTGTYQGLPSLGPDHILVVLKK